MLCHFYPSTTFLRFYIHSMQSSFALYHCSSIQHFCFNFLFSFYILSILSHYFLNQSILYELAYFFFTNNPYSSPLYNFFVNISIHLYCHYHLFLLLLSLKHFYCLWIPSIHLVPIGILDSFIYLLYIYTFCLNQFLSFYIKHPEHQLVIHNCFSACLYRLL